MISNKKIARRASTNPFDSSSDEEGNEKFQECLDTEELLTKSEKRLAPLDFNISSHADSTIVPALVFNEERKGENQQGDFLSPLAAAFLRVNGELGDPMTPSSAENQDMVSSDDDENDIDEKNDVKETQWSRIVRMTSPFVEKMNESNRRKESGTEDDEIDTDMLTTARLPRIPSYGSFVSAKSENSETKFPSVGEQLVSTPHRSDSKKSLQTKKSPGRRKSSIKRRRSSSNIFSRSSFNPVLEKLECSSEGFENSMYYRSPETPWTHLILLEDLGTASSWTVLLIPYIAFIFCLLLDADTELMVHKVGPLSAGTSCSSTGYNNSVPLIPPPLNPCSFPFTLSEGEGILAYGGKGYATVQEHYHSWMPTGAAFSSAPLANVPPMSTFLRGDASFTNLPTAAVAMVAQGKVVFSSVVSQRKSETEWVPLSISNPSRLSMACSLIGRSSSYWNCSSPRIVDVLFSLPGTAILTGTELEVSVLYSYYRATTTSEPSAIEYITSSLDETDKKHELSYVFSDSGKTNLVLLNATLRNPNDLINGLVKASSYTIERQRCTYETVDIIVRLLTLTVTTSFLVFWCWSMGWKGFCGVWGEADGCIGCCSCFWKRRRSDSEDLPIVRRKTGGFLWWESPWLLFPERRYLLFLLFCLLLLQNPLLAYAHFVPSLYSRKNIHAAADAMVGIGVHGILMSWLCLFCGLRYHTAAVTRRRAKQQRQLLQLRRTAKYTGEADHSMYGTEDSISRYTAAYYDQFGDVDGSGSVSHLRMKHDPCGDSWADFLLPKIFIFLIGSASVLVTAMCRFPADGDNAATLQPELLRRYNAIYIFSSTVQLSVLISWVFLIIRNAYLTGAKLKKEPFLSTRPAQLAFRVMSSSLFLGLTALAVPIFMDVCHLIKKWHVGNNRNHHPMDIGSAAASTALDIWLRVLLQVSKHFPYSGTASSVGPGKILFATTCALVTAFIFLPSRTFLEDEGESREQRKKAMDGSSVFNKTLSEKLRQRRDKRTVVTLARYTHTWRVFPLPIKKVTLASDVLAGGSFVVNTDFRIRKCEASEIGVVYVGSYMPVFCVEIACWLLEASWQSYYSPKEYSTNDWAPGRMSLESIGLQLETAINDESTQTQAIVATNLIPQVDGDEDSVIVVAFRGTTTVRNVKTDLKFHQVPLPERMMGSGVDDRACFQVHTDHILASDYSGWVDWMGTSAENFEASSLHNFSPRSSASLDHLGIQWLAKKPSKFTTVSSGAKAVIRATPVARQALPCVHEGFLEAYAHLRRQLWESLLLVLQRQFAKAVRRSRRCGGISENNAIRLPKIYVCGHSLGGSLGQLLALDLASNCELIIEIAEQITTAEELFALPGVEASPPFKSEISRKDISSKRDRHDSFPDPYSPKRVLKRFFSDNDIGDGNSDQVDRGVPDTTNITGIARRKVLRLQPPVAVYTFGQPRVGNRAFARLYKRRVPHTFRVSTEGDAFTTMPKFSLCGGLYKHAGLEVMLDEGQTGNTLVGPTVVETLFRFTKVRTSVAAHSLERYRDCLESALDQDELNEYYRGRGSKGSHGAGGQSGVGRGSVGVTASLPDWVTQIKRSTSDD